MDTLVVQDNRDFSKLIEATINFSIIGVVVLSFAMQHSLFSYATDMKLAQGSLTALSPPIFDTGQMKEKILNEISPAARIKNFEDKIKKKYPGATIYNVDDGVKHIKLTKYYQGKPVRINVVEADLKIAKDLKLTPALSSDSTLQSRRTITTIAKNTNAVVALNGTFFKPQTGVPLGTLMIDKKMYTGPIYDRVALGIFENGSANKFDIARVQLNANIFYNKETIKVDNINQPRMLASYILVYTPEWGKIAPPSPQYGMQIAVDADKVIKSSTAQLNIPENGYVIVGPKDKLGQIAVEKKIELSVITNPEWKNVEHIISGGPYLVKDSEVFVDMTAQKLAAIGGRNPRSAIGYTEDDNLILVAVDGRENSSIGMTLNELAGFMKSIGCTNAMNLDGGGSTVMYVNGKVVNTPAQQGGIPLSNAIVLTR